MIVFSLFSGLVFCILVKQYMRTEPKLHCFLKSRTVQFFKFKEYYSYRNDKSWVIFLLIQSSQSKTAFNIIKIRFGNTEQVILTII